MVKKFKPHNTGSWYLLGVLFKISEEHLHPLNMEEPPSPPPTPFARWNLQKVNVIRTELHEDIQYFLYKTLHWHKAWSLTNGRSIQHWHDEDERLKRKCQKTIKDDDKGCAWHSSDWLRKISYACGGGNMTSMIDIWVGFSHHTISMKEVGRFASEVLAKQEDHQ